MWRVSSVSRPLRRRGAAGTDAAQHPRRPPRGVQQQHRTHEERAALLARRVSQPRSQRAAARCRASAAAHSSTAAEAAAAPPVSGAGDGDGDALRCGCSDPAQSTHEATHRVVGRRGGRGSCASVCGGATTLQLALRTLLRLSELSLATREARTHPHTSHADAHEHRTTSLSGKGWRRHDAGGRTSIIDVTDNAVPGHPQGSAPRAERGRLRQPKTIAGIGQQRRQQHAAATPTSDGRVGVQSDFYEVLALEPGLRAHRGRYTDAE
jgi:hypothetical protein